MKSILLGILVCGLVVTFAEEGVVPDFSSPEATFNTFVEAILHRDQDLAIHCFSMDLEADLSEGWEEEELPDSVVYEVIDEYHEEDYAELDIRIWDDIAQEEIVETFYFILEDDEWKMTWMDYDDPYYDYDSMSEDFEEW
jgi:hypothetical protein